MRNDIYYSTNQAGNAWDAAWAAMVMGDMDGFTAAINDFIFWQNKQWDLGGQLWGTEWQELNLSGFQENINTLIQWGNSLEAMIGNTVSWGHEDIGEDVASGISGYEEGVGWRRDYVGSHEEIVSTTDSVEDLGTTAAETTTHLSAFNDALPPIIENAGLLADQLYAAAEAAAFAAGTMIDTSNNLNWRSEVNA